VPRLTAERAQARRQQIVDAAMACFARRGLHGTTMHDICRKARLSPGAVYCWFDSKEQIVEAVAEERHARERHMLEEALAAGDESQVLARFLDAYFDWLAQPAEKRRRRVGVQVWAEALVDRRLRSIVAEGIGQRRLALDFVRAAQAGGRLPADVDPDSLLRVVLAVIQGFILQQAWEPGVDVASYHRAVTFLLGSLAGN
jgi:AcrR family transcriptional regulator